MIHHHCDHHHHGQGAGGGAARGRHLHRGEEEGERQGPPEHGDDRRRGRPLQHQVSKLRRAGQILAVKFNSCHSATFLSMASFSGHKKPGKKS